MSDVHILNRYEPLHRLEQIRDGYIQEIERLYLLDHRPGSKCYDLAMKRKQQFDDAIKVLRQFNGTKDVF